MQFTDPNVLTGLPVIGRDNDRLGVVESIYVEAKSDRQQWAAVRSGLFGHHVSLVPLGNAEHDGKTLRIPYSTKQLKHAPHQEPGRAMSRKEEADLFRHYGVSYGGDKLAPRQSGLPQRLAAGQAGNGAAPTLLRKYAPPAGTATPGDTG